MSVSINLKYFIVQYDYTMEKVVIYTFFVRMHRFLLALETIDIFCIVYSIF